MLPTLEPADRLLVDTVAYRGHPPRSGDIVVLVDPEEAARWLVKRVHRVDAQAATLEVRGDAAERARDSRHFGPVRFSSVIGKVYRIYFPPHRRREL